MKRIGSVVLCCLGVTAVGASGALAVNGNSTPNPNQVASQICTSELHTMGVKAFKGLYGDPHKSGDPAKKQHAMRNCKRQNGHRAGNVVNNAAQQCRQEQATWDPNAHGGLTFDESYGTNPNDKNAFGKCVSGKAQAAVAQIQENLENAAQQCRAERNLDADAFRDNYGLNKNKKNAFGKCVSQKAKAQNSSSVPTA